MPKLTLRDLFAVMTIVAVLIAWWVDHRRMERQLQAWKYETKAFQLTNTKSDDLAAVLRKLYEGDLDSPLAFASDARTNTVIVRGPAGKISEVEKTLLQLDGLP
jgi:hypothetical protein